MGTFKVAFIKYNRALNHLNSWLFCYSFYVHFFCYKKSGKINSDSDIVVNLYCKTFLKKFKSNELNYFGLQIILISHLNIQ